MNRHKLTLLEDMNESASDTAIPWEKLRGSTVLVTGATGVIGSALVRTLFAADATRGLGIRTLAFGRDVRKAAALVEKYSVIFCRHNVREPFTLSENVDYIFHCAAITTSAEMVKCPVDVMDTSINGTKNVLELARDKRVKSVVYVSSMEVYGQEIDGEVTELDLGRLDLKDPRTCYPESKRVCETLCSEYFSQYGVSVKTARLAQTFGAGTPRDDTRVFAQFARSVLAQKDIVLHTNGRSRGNYCYTTDAVRALLTLLLKGENGQVYNVANPDAGMTIREMAELVATEVAGGRVSVVVNIPDDIKKRGYAPESGYILNIDKIKLLGWYPRYNLAQMYERMIAEWMQ